MIYRAQLKQEAKGILSRARVSPYVLAFVFLALTFMLDTAGAYTSGSYVKALEQYFPETMIPAFLLRPISLSPMTITFIGVITMLLSQVLQAGWCLYHLGIRRGREMPYSTLFDGFSVAGRVILLVVLETAFVLLWSFLFVIPGIVAAYRYRYALYNLLEDPALSPLEAIRMSKAQTYGYKLDLFVLDLSFLGWGILCGLTLGILSIWLAPYMVQTDVGAFEAIKTAKGIGAGLREDPPVTES